MTRIATPEEISQNAATWAVTPLGSSPISGTVTVSLEAVRNGIGYASEDRKHFGLVLPMTVRENTTMSIHHDVLNRLGLISAKRENAERSARMSGETP